MNRKQLFTNPAETNAHGSIRTAKWAKGAVAVVALSGAFGVASMNTTTASADEIQTEVVAPAATEEVATTPTEAVVVEQPVAEVTPVVEKSAPVEEVASVETPATEVTTAVEEVASVAETTVAVAEEVATAPTVTVAAEQPAVETANDTSSEAPTSDVTAAEVVTNADVVGKDISNQVSLDAKIVTGRTEADALQTLDTGSFEASSNYRIINLTSTSGAKAGDYFDLYEDMSFGAVTIPASFYDSKGEVFATQVTTVLKNEFVGVDSYVPVRVQRRFTLTKDVDNFEINLSYFNASDHRVFTNSTNSDALNFYPANEQFNISIGDEEYTSTGVVKVNNRYVGASNQLHYYLSNNGVVGASFNNWISELDANGSSLGIPETLVTITIPDDVPVSFKDLNGSSPLDGVVINEHLSSNSGNGDIRVTYVQHNSIDDADFLNSHISLVSSTDKVRVYRVAKRDGGSTPLSYHFNPTLVVTDTSFITKDITLSDLRNEFKDLGTTLVATTEDSALLESSRLSSFYDVNHSRLYLASYLSGSDAELKKMNIIEKDNDGVYQYLQVKDVDTKELVPVSEYEVKDTILPQVPGTQLVSKDIFSRLNDEYEVAEPYTEVQDPMTTVWVKRVKFDNILNAVLEDGTVIKENMDATGLLKVGETFTLDAEELIEYNGTVYIVKDGKLTVDGTTIDKAQVLTKVYVYSPRHNHAFVDLTVNHIDKETGTVMKTTTTGNHEETTTYTTNAETFPEYNLVATPDNATGTFGKDAVVVNYYYIHKKGNVVAKFVREDGTEIAPVVNVVTNVNTGTDYTATHPAEIAFDGTVYRYTSTDGSEAGKVTEGTTTITNRYVLVKGTLIEKYVDVNGAEIKVQNTVLDDAPVKTAYSLEHPNEIQANGTTYRYVRTDGSETGQLVEGTTVVTYIYDTVKGDVVVKVVDAKTGNDIFPAETVVDDKPITKTTYDVTSYNKARITGKDGKTWDLVSVDGSQTGKVVEGVTTITFKYNEVKTSVTTKLVSTDGKELRSPSTDADLSTGVTYNTISKAPEVIYATDSNVYKRTAVPSNSQGITTVDPITVTYVYELQTAEPTKTIASTDGRDLTGKVLLAGDKVVYNFSTDLAKFKGIDGLSTEDKQHALIIVEDIADEFLTPNMSQASVSSGKAFLNYYASIEEAPESIKSVLSAKEVSTTGGFAVLTSFNPLATAEEVKAQNLAFFNEFTNKGLNVSVVLPTTVNATVDNAKIENKVIQIDFDGVTESPVVVNETPDINPTKDIVLNAGDEESLQGKQITVGTVFNYELNGTIYPANRGNKLTSYQQVDKHSDKVLPTGVYLTKATAEIQFEDGYKLGDEIIIPAGTVVKGSWVTPVDIVSDKDGSVIKAGSTVVKDGSRQVEYTIEKDIVVAAGTDVTGIVFPIGSDFSAIFRQFIDAENNTVTYSMRQDAFEKISADSAFGFTTYMQVEQIAAGTTENTYTEIVNGVETKSNTVTHEGVEPEVPGEDTPTPSTPVVNTPGIPANTPVSAAGVATLPNTGEENSSAAALAGAAMLVAALGLAGRRRKEER